MTPLSSCAYGWKPPGLSGFWSCTPHSSRIPISLHFPAPLLKGCCFGLLGFGFSRSQLPYLINKRFLWSCHIKFDSDNVLLHPIGWRFYSCCKILTNYLATTKAISFPIWIKAIWKTLLLAFPFASFLVFVLVLFVSLSRGGLTMIKFPLSEVGPQAPLAFYWMLEGDGIPVTWKIFLPRPAEVGLAAKRGPVCFLTVANHSVPSTSWGNLLH